MTAAEQLAHAVTVYCHQYKCPRPNAIRLLINDLLDLLEDDYEGEKGATTHGQPPPTHP